MRNKTKRLLTIRKLIESELISSQEELLFRLKEMNVEATQSTLSRDLKFMKVAKIPHKEKGYIYVIPESIQNEQREEKVSAIITDTILSIDFSGNMDTCIAIRMAVKTNGKVYVQAGGGIVADSVPEKEYEESANKAMAVINAIERAGEVED